MLEFTNSRGPGFTNVSNSQIFLSNWGVKFDVLFAELEGLTFGGLEMFVVSGP